MKVLIISLLLAFLQCASVDSPRYHSGYSNQPYGYGNTGMYPYYRNYNSQNPYNRQFYPYQNYRGNIYGGGHNHNPFHIPGGRYKNSGNPRKWRL
ncbi:MAG: hypothetical protein KDK54_16030 [Leptospiraceae bacterium]|nr:hypothetical protein [Leptospiraceae bacterium]